MTNQKHAIKTVLISTADVQNFIRKNLTGDKTKGANTCRINELIRSSD